MKDQLLELFKKLRESEQSEKYAYKKVCSATDDWNDVKHGTSQLVDKIVDHVIGNSNMHANTHQSAYFAVNDEVFFATRTRNSMGEIKRRIEKVTISQWVRTFSEDESE